MIGTIFSKLLQKVSQIGQRASIPREKQLSRLLIVTGIYPPDDGGPATYVPIIAELFTKRGIKVEVITFSPPSVSSSERTHKVWRISRNIPLPIRFIYTTILIFWRLLKYDIVYVNGLYGPSALCLSLLRNKLSIAKYVGDPMWERAHAKGWYREDIDQFQESKAPFIRFIRWIRAVVAKRFDHVIVPSQYLGQLVSHWGISDNRIHVIYNAVPLQAPSNRALRNRECPELIVVSRLVPHKQVEQVIRVLASLPAARLTIIGDGPLRSQLQEYSIQIGLADRINFVGAISRPRTLEYISSADLLLLNSSYEGLPHVILEATACGVPVVARASGGTPEAIIENQTGILVKGGSDSALLSSIREGLKPEAFKDFSWGQQKIVERFSMKKMIDSTTSVIESAYRGELGQFDSFLRF